MQQPTLSFQNYGDPTVNGSQLGTFGFAANNIVGNSNSGLSFSGSSNLAGQGAAQTVATPQTATASSAAGPSFWSKDGGAGLALGGIQVLGNLWNSYQSHKIAKEQLSFAREQWSTNLANQTQTYNTALEDRIRARHFTEGKDSAQTDRYIEKNSL